MFVSKEKEMMDWNYKSTVAILIATTLLCVACHTDDKLLNYMKKHPIAIGDSCIVDLQEVLGIQYDSMYLFHEDLDFLIPQVLNMPQGKLICDSHQRIFLFKDGNPIYIDDFQVYHIDFFPISERYFCPNTEPHYSFLVHYNSVYIIKQSRKDYYQLKLLDDGREQYEVYYDEQNHLR